jgi:hypothetical protein
MGHDSSFLSPPAPAATGLLLRPPARGPVKQRRE